jgi:two-component system chemotaxis sensor kinase CheA
MDMTQYKDLFISEVREHLHTMNDTIVALERDPGNRDKIDTLFRMAHSIKGMAASMGYEAMAELAHTMEDLMDKVRKKAFGFEAGIADLLLEAADRLAEMVRGVAGGDTSGQEITGLLRKLAGYTPASGEQREGSEPGPQRDEAVPVRGITGAAESIGQKSSDRKAGQQTVRVRTAVLDSLVNITGELVTSKNRLANIARASGSRSLDTAVSDLSRQVRELHDEILKLRLMPFGAAADRLPRTVRDVAKKSGKDVSLRISGREIELDRSILEEIADPLLHILRNAVDHGIETPAERLAAGKPPSGTIAIKARKEHDRVIISVADDGKGMDPGRIIAAAREKGLISEDEGTRLSPRQAFLLICLPGFSTAREVTGISGRGVGMDVVRSSLKSIGGNLSIDAEPGRGTSVNLSLPVTISIIQVLLVGCASMSVAIPVDKILRTIDIKREAITVNGRRTAFMLGDEHIPLLSLSRLLRLPFPSARGPGIPAVMVELRGRKAGLLVDRIIGQQDVFVKPFGRPLNRMRGLMGGAVLGDGQIVCILDPAELVR